MGKKMAIWQILTILNKKLNSINLHIPIKFCTFVKQIEKKISYNYEKEKRLH